MHRILFLISLIISIAGLTGCSSSTYTSRYESDDEKADTSSHQRFSDQENFNTGVDSLYSEEDEIPEDEGIDIASVMSQLKSDKTVTDMEADNSNMKEKLLMEIIKYLNTPYKYGGNSTDGIDCSAFTQTVYHNVLSLDLDRSARDQYKQGVEIDNQDELKFGDLVFFNTRRRVKPGHVGIYIGDNLFAHASSRNGVIVSSLDQEYYSKRFMGGRRVEQEDVF
ncbi:MAG TPA: C40 family peptidase [Ignavibacteriaceae bacterium]